MASYQQNPAYNTYSFRPYELPVNEIFNAIQAKSAYWTEGAMQVRSAYEQAANLELSHKSSKDKLKNFMVGANDLIAKVGKTDLSIAENRTAGMNIFKPLYDDKSLMLDDQLTKYYKSQFQLAERAKTQNGGKDYSATNEGYMMEKYNDFVNDGNEANWENHYNSRRAYTPYYNYRSEFDEVLKNCKPDSVEGNTMDGLYFLNDKIKTLSSTKLSGCLQSGLSDRAKNQIRMEGYMGFGKNYEAVGQRYLDYTANELDAYGKKRGAIDGQLQALREKGKTTTLTDAEKIQMSTLEQSLQGVDTYINDQQKTRKAIASGDLKYIQDNYEDLSGRLYLNDKLNEFSNYYSYSEQERKFEENNAAIAQYRAQNDATQLATKFKQEQLLEEQRQANRMELARFREASNGGSGTRIIGPDGNVMILPDYPLVDPNSNMGAQLLNQSEKDVNDRFDAAIQSKEAADNYIFNELKTLFPNKGNAQDFIKSEEFANYMKTHPDDIRLKRWNDVSDIATKEITKYSAIRQEVEDDVRKNNPSLFDNSIIKTIPTVYLGTRKEVALTPERMSAALSGSDPEFKIVNRPTIFGALTGIQVGAIGTGDRVFFGKIDVTDQPGVQKLLNEVSIANDENIDKIKKAREKAYTDKKFMVDNFRAIGQDNVDKNKSGNQVRARIGSALGIPQNKVENNVFLVASDLKGKVFVDIQGENVPEDVETKLEFLKAKKVGDNRYELNNVPEYRYFSGNSFQDSQLADIHSKITVNQENLNRGIPVDIPISLKGSNSIVPDYKLVVTKGIVPGQLFYNLAIKTSDGTFKKIDTGREIIEPVDALKIIEELEKVPR
ncbi:MAG: hypothetical protein E6Q36_08495 [Chryseobacterium sp.]|nr:MAG: hypothetical protein E6Q36_08495 [Chryseobacterium sp.]